MKHPIDVAAEAVGSQAALARKLGVERAAVNQWKNKGRCTPIEHCATIEIVVGGAVKRWDLRPDDWYRIWPELIGQEGAPAVPEAAQARG